MTDFSAETDSDKIVPRKISVVNIAAQNFPTSKFYAGKRFSVGNSLPENWIPTETETKIPVETIERAGKKLI